MILLPVNEINSVNGVIKLLLLTYVTKSHCACVGEPVHVSHHTRNFDLLHAVHIPWYR